MLNDTDIFIERITHFLSLRDKEAGAGNLGRGIMNFGNKLRRGTENIVENTLAPARDMVSDALGHSKAQKDALRAEAKKAIVDRYSKTKDSINRSAMKDLWTDSLKQSPNNTINTVTGDARSQALTKLKDAIQEQTSLKAGRLKGDNLESFKKNALDSGNYKDIGDTKQISDAINKYTGNSGVRKLVYNNPKKALTTGAIAAGAGGLYLGSDIGDSPEVADMGKKHTAETSNELLKDLETPAASRDKAPAKTNASTWQAKLSEQGNKFLTGIQDFANTSAGATTIGGTTGAGIAYIADKLLTKDSEEESTEGRRLLLTLLGGALGAGAGYGINAYRQKKASETMDVRTLIQREAEALSDKDLESKVKQMEYMEKQASYSNWIADRLKLHFHRAV